MLCGQRTWVHNSVSSLPICVTSGKLLDFFVRPFLHTYFIPISYDFKRIKTEETGKKSLSSEPDTSKCSTDDVSYSWWQLLLLCAMAMAWIKALLSGKTVVHGLCLGMPPKNERSH